MPTTTAAIHRNTRKDPSQVYCEHCGTLIAPENVAKCTAHSPQPDGTCEHLIACSEECFESVLFGG